MADQLYLSYWLRNFNEQNMLKHYDKLLRIFPFSRLARQPSTFKVIAVDYNEPTVLEVPLPAPVQLDQVMSAAKDFAHADSCYRLETWWDLWQFETEWKLTPSRVALCCFGPAFQHENDGDLGIDFGIDANFLPRPDVQGSARIVQSNIKSLLKLVHDGDDALPVETRRLWTESGEDFSEKLHQALSTLA